MWNSSMVVIVQGNGLTAERWYFSLVSDWRLLLEAYTMETRKTMRGKFKVIKRYDRALPEPDYRVKTLAEADVPLTATVRDLAAKQVLLNLEVVKWSEVVK
jgi:hypothetical protein